MVADVVLWFIAPTDWDRKLCVLYISVCVSLCGEPRERISPTRLCWSPDSTGTDGECVKYGKWTHHPYLTHYMLTNPPTFTPSVQAWIQTISVCSRPYMRGSVSQELTRIWLQEELENTARTQQGWKTGNCTQQVMCAHRHDICCLKSSKFLFVISEVTVCCVISSRDFGWNEKNMIGAHILFDQKYSKNSNIVKYY